MKMKLKEKNERMRKRKMRGTTQKMGGRGAGGGIKGKKESAFWILQEVQILIKSISIYQIFDYVKILSEVKLARVESYKLIRHN